MPQIRLKYGRTEISFDYEDGRFEVLGHDEKLVPLTDVEIGDRLDSPIDSPSLDEIVSAGESVLIVVPDATRQTAAGQIVSLLVRRLIANGITSHDIRIIFATGIHRHVTEAEKLEILTPFVAQRIKTLNHDPRDLMQIIRLGETSGGIPVELNRALLENDHVILVGGVNFHYFAGFTGGRKLVCPGLASAKTVSATHKLAFDCDTRSRRDGVDTAVLDRNAVNESFMEAVAKVEPVFAISTIVNDKGEAVDLFCGNWITSHREACDAYAERHTIKIREQRDLVIVSCGGYPHDINMIQAHKALEAASRACGDGGTIILVAECSDGIGRSDFLDWFKSENSGILAERLCKSYQVNGQTAWSLLKKAETFDIRVISEVDQQAVGRMGLKAEGSLRDALSTTDPRVLGYVLPFGAKFMLRR